MNYNAPTGGNVLTFGILGLAFSGTAILGLIFSIIGKNKAKAYAAAYGQVTGTAKVGSILATIGLVISIIMIVCYLIIIIAGLSS